MTHKNHERDSFAFAQQTAVMMALPHATHAMWGNDWRAKADALIEGLAQQGFLVAKTETVQAVVDAAVEIARAKPAPVEKPCYCGMAPAHEPWCPSWKAPS